MSEHQKDPVHRRCRSFPALSLHQLWISLPFFLLLLKGFLFPLPLLDFWWHLRMGRVILDTWSIPGIDSFSFTAAGKVFIVQNWLAEVLFYLIYKIAGFPLLVFMNAILLACMLVPIFQLCRRTSVSFGTGILAACLVAICLPCNLRPQVFSYVLFAVYYWILSSYCSGKRNWIWLLPFLMALWVNLHGAFVLGMVLVAIFLCCESIRFLLHTSEPDVLRRVQLVKLALVFILCAIATLANPEKLAVYSYLQTVINDPSSRQLVMEWQPPAIGSIRGIVQFYLPFFLTTLSLMASDRRPTLTEIALYAGFSVFGMTAVRNAAWFLLVSAPILARHLPAHHWVSVFTLPIRGLQPRLTSPPGDTHGRKEHPLLNLAIACIALVVLGLQSPWVQQRFYGRSLFDPNTPVGAMDYIETHSLTGNIFHPQAYGDYLIWRLWPRQRSFFDGRVHLFGEPFVREYQMIYNDSHGEERLGKYNIRLLLLSKSEEKPEGRKMIDRVRGSGDWKLLYEDNISILFEKHRASIDEAAFESRFENIPLTFTGFRR
jgi:hypothetical protein